MKNQLTSLELSKELKVYIWENVLTDYTDGMVCIIARDLEHAREVFLKKYSNEQYVLDNFFAKPYKVVTEPDAFYVYGCG